MRFTIEEAGMKGLKNGELLRLASEQYDLFVTVDQNLTFQQNLQSLKISVLILAAKKNTYGALKPLMPKALEALKIINPGEVIFIGVL